MTRGIPRRSLAILFLGLSFSFLASMPSSNAQLLSLPVESSAATSTSPLEITGDQIEYDQKTDVYTARGSVVVVQRQLRLTADHVSVSKLSGRLTARGHVHVSDAVSDVWAERFEIDVNTEAGVVTEGTLFKKETNTFVSGRLLQRFSETHYRAKDGSFTNCDAQDGQIPAWQFTFDDLDLDLDDSVYAENVWFHVKDYPIIPLPTLRYPMIGQRKTGFLVPTVGLDNAFGFRYRQGFFWALTPSQDLTITPQVLSKRGGGTDLEYRYILNRQSKGKWLVSSLYDTDEDQGRAQVRGSHIQQVNPDLSVKMNVNMATDRDLLQDLSSSGILRALPSQESNLLISQGLNHGNLYLLGQYIQPLENGGKTTFQRLPEVGHRLANIAVFDSPFVVGMDSTFVHFFREEGFDVSRVDLLPRLSVEGLHIGHAIGLKPEVKLREVIYSHGQADTADEVETRETFWVGLEATSSLSRRFQMGKDWSLRHAIEPKIIYEYVPDTKQSRFVEIDGVDELVKKNLVTYSLATRLTESHVKGTTSTWLDLLLAQSYHLGGTPGRAEPFSDIWTRATFNTPVRFAGPLTKLSLKVDGFYDPNRTEVSQFNSDLHVQAGNHWYFQVGQRHARAESRVRRGDIWNPISFNEVLDARSKINFLTAGGGVRLPFGWTVGSKVYHDFETGDTTEWDVVGLYQSPCRCWSLGLYYIGLDGGEGVEQRNQFNFMITLRGLGSTQGFGSQVMKAILSPLLRDENGLPWSP